MKSSKQHSYSLEQHFNRKLRGEKVKIKTYSPGNQSFTPPPPSKYRAKPGTPLTFLLNRKERGERLRVCTRKLVEESLISRFGCGLRNSKLLTQNFIKFYNYDK